MAADRAPPVGGGAPSSRTGGAHYAVGIMSPHWPAFKGGAELKLGMGRYRFSLWRNGGCSLNVNKEKDMEKLPPPMVGSAKLIQFADAGPPVLFTGIQSVYVGGQLIGPAPRLAICQQVSDMAFYLFLCNERWEVIAAVGGDRVSSLISRAERWYQGINAKWVSSPYSDADFQRYLDAERGDMRCSFCRRWDWEYSVRFSHGKCNICDICVKDFGAQLSENEALTGNPDHGHDTE